MHFLLSVLLLEITPFQNRFQLWECKYLCRNQFRVHGSLARKLSCSLLKMHKSEGHVWVEVFSQGPYPLCFLSRMPEDFQVNFYWPSHCMKQTQDELCTSNKQKMMINIIFKYDGVWHVFIAVLMFLSPQLMSCDIAKH